MDKKFKHQEKNDFFNNLDNQVKAYTKDGTSKPQAIALVCKKIGLNPYKVIDKYYPEIKSNNVNAYKDVKTSEGTFVTIKADPEQKHYEVININNKDAIVLRNTDNNEEITASENEITPVITENKMNKLNEAQYNISIDGLETQDAATLSQMLNLANQAEQSASTIAPAGLQSDIAVEPMDVNSGMPMDMDSPMDTNIPSIDEPSVEDMGLSMDMDAPIEDDIEFDEELPSDDMGAPMDVDQEIPSDLDTASTVDDAMDANNTGDEMSMDDMIDNNMYDDFMESFDYDALIKEAMEAAEAEGNEEEITEAEQTIPASEDIDDMGQAEGEQEQYAKEITEAEDDDNTYENVDEFMSDYFYDNAELQSEYDYEELENHKEEIFAKWHELVEDGANEYEAAEDAANECIANNEFKENFDDEIAEALRIAGVKLEEANNEPKVVDQETLYINKDKEKEDQEPQYTEVETDTFSKDGSEGFKPSMTFESAVNMKKIKSIYETAKSMYAKKDISEWMSLDRRYVEKLIREGVGFEKASKMIIEAKKGK